MEKNETNLRTQSHKRNVSRYGALINSVLFGCDHRRWTDSEDNSLKKLHSLKKGFRKTLRLW